MTPDLTPFNNAREIVALLEASQQRALECVERAEELKAESVERKKEESQ